MLRLQSISLTHFKNYALASYNFQERIIGICGLNGAGKTNLLDAIYYLCFTRSYFHRNDIAHVKEGNHGFRIEGTFMLHKKNEKAICIFRENGRKEFHVNEKEYNRFSNHIGRYPCVFIAPDDAVLITGGSEERRHFIDSLLAQIDADYLRHLIQYQKVLHQRNALLKSFAETGRYDASLLQVLDEQLSVPGNYIFNKRKLLLTQLIPLSKDIYTAIACMQEDINLEYESELLSNEMGELLKAYRQKDLQSLRTCTGIHKDDLAITLNRKPFKQIASQGQRKSLLFALKLAELEILQKEKGFAPLLLLDDVLEKLDEKRIHQLLQKVCVENYGQVFITDTDTHRLSSKLQNINVRFQLINL